jgi:two-component sensor histidine kinase
MGAGRHLVAQRRDGSTIAVEIRLSAMDTVDGPRVVVSIRDVGERRRQKEQLQRALKARDTLLREVYHRVKNNLQVVSSLLRWHARSAGDRPCAEVLEDAQARIHAMAIVHETLANAERADEVDFASYVRELVRGMQLAQQGQAGEIDVRIDIDDRIGVPLDRAVPCGLIVHELVSNAFEHAFPEGFDSGDAGRQVRILLERSRHHLTLVVADNGVGMPRERRRGSLGLELVRVLARQVGSDLIFTDGPGTRVEVRCRRTARS